MPPKTIHEIKGFYFGIVRDEGERKKMPNTSFKKIFNFWKDKAITKMGDVVTSEYYGGPPIKDEIDVIVDWGEPMCWCCGSFAFDYQDPKYEELLTDANADVGDIWEMRETKQKLERCHIIPAMLGGEDKPENLFLLCPRCHRDSPDTKYPQMFFRYIYEKRTHKETNLEKALEILKNDYGIKYPVFDNFEELYGKAIGQHGGMINDISIVLGYVGNALENNKKDKEASDMLLKYLEQEIAKSEKLRQTGLYTDVDHERYSTLLEIKVVLQTYRENILGGRKKDEDHA